MNGIVNTDNLIRLLVRVFVILCCFPVHECAHAWTADRLGDPTPRRMGRISLNPFRHLDLFGTLTIFLFGVGYAKPVPVSLQASEAGFCGHRRCGAAIKSPDGSHFPSGPEVPSGV